MSKLLKVSLLLAFAIALFGAYRYGQAQDALMPGQGPDRPPTFDVENSAEPDGVATKHALEGTYNNTGLAEVTTSAGVYTPIDTQLTVVCPGTSGTCTIQGDFWMENGNASTSNNENEICLYVDGSAAPHCDYYTGVTPSDGNWIGSSNSQGVSGVAQSSKHSRLC